MRYLSEIGKNIIWKSSDKKVFNILLRDRICDTTVKLHNFSSILSKGFKSKPERLLCLAAIECYRMMLEESKLVEFFEEVVEGDRQQAQIFEDFL
jgi:hypothetical protein